MVLKAVRLRFNSLVLGELDSIKLTGAFVSALSELDESKMEELKNCLSNGDAVVSSVFPLVKETYFFPMPLFPINFNQFLQEISKIDGFKGRKERFSFVKNFKKIRFVSKKVLEKLLTSVFSASELEKKIDFGVKNSVESNFEWVVKNGFLFEKNELSESDFSSVSFNVVSRNVLNRFSLKSNIFSSVGNYFNNCFFLFKGSEKAFELIKIALNFLNDKGLSQDYSIGFGEFKIVSINNFELIEGNDSSVCFSKFISKNNELFGSSRYSLKEIIGLNKDGKHIYPTLVLKEGSYFNSINLSGRIVKIVESNKVLFGKPFLVKSVAWFSEGEN